jgi:hypothetical protein
MPQIELTKDIEGRLCGATEKDQRAYVRFIDRCVRLTADESLKFQWTEPRSGPFHRRHFKMLGELFKQQEQFLDDEVFRKWAELEAGYFDTVPGRDEPQRIPKSIAYDKLDQLEFQELHAKVFAFYRSEYALMVMWPQLSWQQALDKIDSVLLPFETP